MSDNDQRQQPFGRDNLGQEISRQVLEDTDSADEIPREEEIARLTAKNFEEQSRFGGEDEFEEPDHDAEESKG